MDLHKFYIQEGEQPLDTLKDTCGFAGIFKQIGVIGDSLSAGEFESRNENNEIAYHDYYEYSWPAILERITGTKYNNYSRGGMTAKEYIDSWADQNQFWQWNQAYIIALGNNDTFVCHHPLGSISDIHPHTPNDNADTFFGNMGRIISKIKSIEKDAILFLVSPQLRGEPCDSIIHQIAKGLEAICKMFSNTYLLNMTQYGPVYDENMRSAFGLGFHPNPMGYYCYALMIGNYIDYMIRKHLKAFAELPFIGTNLKYSR